MDSTIRQHFRTAYAMARRMVHGKLGYAAGLDAFYEHARRRGIPGSAIRAAADAEIATRDHLQDPLAYDKLIRPRQALVLRYLRGAQPTTAWQREWTWPDLAWSTSQPDAPRHYRRAFLLAERSRHAEPMQAAA